MSTKNACLFGGTLLAVGMASTASGQAEFIFDFDYAFGNSVLGYGYAEVFGNPVGYSYAYGGTDSFDGGASPPYGYSFAGTTGTSDTLNAYAQWNGNGFERFGVVKAVVEAVFQVTEDTVAYLNWDVSGVFNSYGFGFVFEASLLTSGQPINSDTLLAEFFNAGGIGGSTGSIAIELEAGVDYVALLGIADLPALFNQGALPSFAGLDSTALQFVELTLVPAPGVAALFGAAGIAATRRRR